MKWTKLKYSKNQVNVAGVTLTSEDHSSDEIDKALTVLGNWRSSHSYPLFIFKKRLKLVSEKVDSNALVVQRLKRAQAIIWKLNREQTEHMALSRMQDIAGCRAVLSNVELVKKLSELYYENGDRCDIKHEFKNKKDYITNPKPDGYRSIHIIYKYKSDKTEKYNGLLIEIQIRSRLQHLWATAVETVGHFTRQALKSNEGEKEWLNFFKLTSTVLANYEKTAIVPDTPQNKLELYEKIKKLSTSLQVIDKIQTWNKAIKFIDELQDNKLKQSNFYLLELDLDNKELFVSTYSKSDEEKATLDYLDAEKKANLEKLNKDIVLVAAETTMELRKAYPNYFADTKEFISILSEYLDNPPDK
jgi:ppGpp synthetase/RelA/SpoT-type nucleotidyltranferase